jgi:hypothetical protein
MSKWARLNGARGQNPVRRGWGKRAADLSPILFWEALPETKAIQAVAREIFEVNPAIFLKNTSKTFTSWPH